MVGLLWLVNIHVTAVAVRSAQGTVNPTPLSTSGDSLVSHGQLVGVMAHNIRDTWNNATSVPQGTPSYIRNDFLAAVVWLKSHHG